MVDVEMNDDPEKRLDALWREIMDVYAPEIIGQPGKVLVSNSTLLDLRDMTEDHLKELLHLRQIREDVIAAWREYLKTETRDAFKALREAMYRLTFPEENRDDGI